MDISIGRETISLPLYIPPGRLSPLLVIPGLGITEKKWEWMMRTFFYRFLRSGYPVILYPLPYHLGRGEGVKDFKQLDDEGTWNFFRKGKEEINRIIEKMEEEFGWKEFYLLGISLGGMLGMMVLSGEEKVKKGIFLGTGGNFEEILWHGIMRFFIPKDCSRRDCHKFHREYQNLLSKGDYRELEKLPRYCFLYDPLTQAHRIKNKDILLIHGLFDTIIPFTSFLSLRKALPHAETLILPASHSTLLFFSPLIYSRIEKFLKK